MIKILEMCYDMNGIDSVREVRPQWVTRAIYSKWLFRDICDVKHPVAPR